MNFPPMLSNPPSGIKNYSLPFRRYAWMPLSKSGKGNQSTPLGFSTLRSPCKTGIKSRYGTSCKAWILGIVDAVIL
jgi:hypothetical protein